MAAPKGNQYAKGNKGPPPAIYDDDFIENEAAALREWIVLPRSLWLKGFAYERGYSPTRMWEFGQKNKEFSNALEFAKDEQERKFIMGAWSKEMDMAFVKHFMPRMLRDRPEWKTSWDAPESSDDSLKALATAVMNYATAQPAGEGWQKPEPKKKK